MTEENHTKALYLYPGNTQAAILVGSISLILVLFLSAAAYFSWGQDPIIFAHIGTRFSEGNPNGTVGYDGQFVYFIARDGAEAVPYIDGPTLRYQRILYPLVGRVLAFGQPDLVPWTLILVNIIAHSVGAGLLAYLVSQLGGSPYIGIIYGIWIGSLFSVRLDLNETLCMALGIGAVLIYLRQRYIVTIFLLMLATMAKELGLIFAAGLALHAFFQHKRQWGMLLAGGPLLLFLTWWGIMWLWFGDFPTRYPSGKIHLIPLQGMFSAKSPFEFLMLVIWLGIPTVVLFIAALRTIWVTRTVPLGAALVIMGAGFVMTMPNSSWEDPAAAYRVALPLIVTGIIFVGQCYPNRWKSLAALWIPSILMIVLIPQLWFGIR